MTTDREAPAMTTADLVARLEELAEKRTAGEWKLEDEGDGQAAITVNGDEIIYGETDDAAFIAFCANHALPLVRELRSQAALREGQLNDGLRILSDQNERLRAELAEAKRDAERYRWIRRHAVAETWGTGRRPLVRLQFDAYANSMDEAIDERTRAVAAKGRNADRRAAP